MICIVKQQLPGTVKFVRYRRIVNIDSFRHYLDACRPGWVHVLIYGETSKKYIRTLKNARQNKISVLRCSE